jgi:hypothetical protein
MKKLILLGIVLGGAVAAVADEGMWTYNNFPKDLVKARYGFALTDEWLKHVQWASARLTGGGGCSASFVSESGLVLTNHHCAHSCIAQLSTAQKDFVKTGFYAKSNAEEVRCPEIEINQLSDITDVTDQISKATKGLEGEKFTQARKAASAQIEKACASDKTRCDVVELYHGGVYNLYKYRRFQDVRLVFAPELATAFFGGDPDNFNFPRYDLDMSMLRVYEDGKPLKTEHFLKWSNGGAKAGDVTFVSGHPGATERQLTMAQLEYQRDVALPERLLYLAEVRGLLTEFGKRSPEAKRISTNDLFGVENAYKALRGRLQALLDPKLIEQKRADENAFKKKLAAKPALKPTLAAFDAIAKTTSELKQIHKPLLFVEQGRGFPGDLFRIAKTLVRGGEERPKPNAERLDEFRDAALPQLTLRLFSKKPIYDDLEILQLTYGLTKLREELGADDPIVRKVLGVESPEELATRVVKGSKLKDLALRQKLWEGGTAAIAASDDPMIKLALLVEPEARALRQKLDDTIDAPLRKYGEQIAHARFQLEGTKTYPDATFTLRLSFGQVRGWPENGKMVDPITKFAGAFARATGRPPFDLPPSWIAAKPKLDLDVPLNFVTTNDIIGGNSGSPMVNKNGELVGLVFDGNIESLGGEYGFDETVNRTVAVHSEGILQALSKIYGADRIVQELRPTKTASR